MPVYKLISSPGLFFRKIKNQTEQKNNKPLSYNCQFI